MKKCVLTVIFSMFLVLNVFGQEFIMDNTKLFGSAVFGTYNYFDSKRIDYYQYLRKPYNVKSKGKPAKKNRTYERLDFTINSVALYSKNVKYKEKADKESFPNCKMYYASNDQLYYDYNPEREKIYENPIFHENGKLWNVLLKDEEDPGIERFVVWDKEGNTIMDKAYLPKMETHQRVNHPKYGSGLVQYIPAKKPSFYPSDSYLNFPTEREQLMDWRSDNKAYCYGYSHLGTFINNVFGYSITGFLLPTTFELGNGSVVFLEDEVNKKNYWAVILDQEIKFIIEAKATEKPNIVELNEQTDVEVYKPHLAKMVSKNIKTLNGYGINLIPQDNIKAGDGIFMEVGFFKNGKLHGIGYRTKMFTTNDRYGDLISIDASYGMFENGQPVNVKYIKANNEKTDKNFWDAIPFDGFNYVGEKSKDLFSGFSNIKLNQLKTSDEIFIEKINRVAKIKSINPQDNSITVFTDNPNIFTKLDKNSGPIYVNETFRANDYASCPKTIKVPIYAEKNETYFVPAEYKSNSYVVKGVYYDKHVTTSSYKPAEVASKKVRYIEKHVDNVCPRCNGTGYVTNGEINKNYWKNIQF
jgi:hypothetical protein